MAPSYRPIVVYAVVIILTIHVLSLMIARLKSAKIKFLPDSTLLLYIAGVILAWFSNIIDAPHETEFNDDKIRGTKLDKKGIVKIFNETFNVSTVQLAVDKGKVKGED